MKSRLNQTLNTAFIVSIALTLWAGTAAAAGRERVYLACDDHTDYYWSADAATYRQAFVEMLDYYLARIDATEREPEPFQARFNCDGNLWLWEYERSKPADQFQRLLRRVQRRAHQRAINADHHLLWRHAHRGCAARDVLRRSNRATPRPAFCHRAADGGSNHALRCRFALCGRGRPVLLDGHLQLRFPSSGQCCATPARDLLVDRFGRAEIADQVELILPEIMRA